MQMPTKQEKKKKKEEIDGNWQINRRNKECEREH
jgi:hypothetical protein